MRKLIVSTYMSLDGVIENPSWTFPYWNAELEQYQNDDLFASDLLLMGRGTYDGFADVWTSRAGMDAFADYINAMPKVVASRTMTTAKWNTTILQGSAVDEIARLKQQDGKHILKYGGGELLRMLVQHNLLDELHLLVFPVFLGSGARLIQQGDIPALKLVETRKLGPDVVALTYQSDAASSTGAAAG